MTLGAEDLLPNTLCGRPLAGRAQDTSAPWGLRKELAPLAPRQHVILHPGLAEQVPGLQRLIPEQSPLVLQGCRGLPRAVSCQLRLSSS